MSTVKRVTSWASGVNNIASPDALPVTGNSVYSQKRKGGSNAVAAGTNVDFMADGEIKARIQPLSVVGDAVGTRLLKYKNEVVFTLPASTWSLPDAAIVAANATALQTPPQDQNGIQILLSAADFFTFPTPRQTDLIQCGAELGGELFFFTVDGSGWRYDGEQTREWCSRSAPTYPNVSVIGGLIPPGKYRVVTTVENAVGEEGPVSPALEIESVDTFGLRLQYNQGVRLYMTPPDGATFYEVFPNAEGDLFEVPLFMEGRRLEHQFLESPTMGEQMAAYNGVLLISNKKLLTVTMPFRPHLVDPVSGFFQFPEDITNVIPVGDGVYITADRTYFLAGVETDSPSLGIVFDEKAVYGSATRISENRVVWMTEFGFVAAADGGKAEFVHRDQYRPGPLTVGGTGVFFRDDREQAIFCNRLAVAPSFEVMGSPA